MSVYEHIDSKSREELEVLRNGCRAARHWMDMSPPPPDFVATGLFAAARYVNHWRCQKCGTYRHDAINANGGLLARRYKYPDGYLLDRDEQRPTSDELRLWMAKRNAAFRRLPPAVGQ